MIRLLIRDKDKPMAAKAWFFLSIIAAIFAIIGAFGNDIYLASTQWTLVAVLFVGWANFMLLEASFRLKR